MSKLGLLLKVELLSFGGFNQLRHSGSKLDRLKLAGIGIFALYIIGSIVATASFYTLNLIRALAAVNAEYLALVVMFTSASLITVLSTMYRTNGTLFNFATYDMLSSMPISARTVVLSRILIGAIVDIAPLAIIMIPAGVTYAVSVDPGVTFWPIFILTLLMLPLIPYTIGALLGVVATSLASRFRSSGLVTVGFGFLLIFGLLFAEFKLFSIKDFTSVAQALGNSITQYYPVARLYADAITGDWVSAGLFALSSLGVFALFLWVISRSFSELNAAAHASRTNKSFRLIAQKQNSRTAALLRKEFSLYFGSPIYVFNTSFGLLLMMIGSLASLFFAPEQFASLLKIPALTQQVVGYIPFALCALVALSCTTAVAISIEGKRLWITQSLPVSSNQILFSKTLVNVILCIIPTTVAVFSFSYSIKLSLGQLFMTLILPLACAIAISTGGLIINLLFPSLDWSSETQAVKQSLAVMVALLYGAALAGAPLIALSVLHYESALVSAGALICYGILGAISTWLLFGGWGARKFARLAD